MIEIFLLGVLSTLVTPRGADGGRPPPVGFWVALGVVVLLALIAPALYFAFTEGKFKGQSVGKLALGIGVRDATDGQLIGFWRAFERYWFNFLLYVAIFIPFLVGNLAPLWDRRRQSWSDHIVDSVVVELRP